MGNNEVIFVGILTRVNVMGGKGIFADRVIGRCGYQKSLVIKLCFSPFIFWDNLRGA